MGYRQALDTFVVELDGVPHAVNKGAVLADDHPVVRHDAANGGRLFAVLEPGEKPDPAAEEAEPAKAPARKAAAKGP